MGVPFVREPTQLLQPLFFKTPRRPHPTPIPVQAQMRWCFTPLSVCTSRIPCRIPVASPLQVVESGRQAWLLAVLNDRTIHGVQEFLINWWGNSPHQWVTGKKLECNAALIEYGQKFKRRLDWTQLDGDAPGAERAGAGASTRKDTRKATPKLDWERSATAVTATKRKVRQLPDPTPRKRPPSGVRSCKY
jgi:hypothetical protein